MGSTSEHSAAVIRSGAWWKVDVSVLGIVTMCQVLSWLDRTNLGNASIAGLHEDLELDNYQYSICLTVTFVPYILAELPSNLLLKAVGPHRLIPGSLVLWGFVTTLQGTVHTYGGLLACRFFLGLFEGGLIPGLVLYLSMFYPRARLQRRVSLVLSASSLAGAFSGLLSAAIVKMDGKGGRPGWAWIFILEGAFTVLFGILIFFIMPRSPKDLQILREDEKNDILRHLHEDGSLGPEDSKDHFSWIEVYKALQSPHVLLLILGAFFHGSILFSLSYFAPTILLGLGFARDSAQLMSVPPYATSFFVTNLSAYLADRYHCRGLTIIISGLVCMSGFTMFFKSHRHAVQYGSMFLTFCGTNAISPASLTWAANNSAPHVRRATSIALISISTNLGGILATWLLGYLSPPPRHTSATLVLILFSASLALCAAVTIAYLWNQNKHKARIRARHTKEERKEPTSLGDLSAWFTYIL